MEKIENKGGYGVSGVKTQEGTDGYIFGGKITFNKKAIGTFLDNGDGGEMSVDFKTKELEAQMLEFLKDNHAEDMMKHEPFRIFLSALSDEDEMVRKVKRMKNKKTFFCLKSDRTEYGTALREMKSPYQKGVIDYLVNKYGEDVEHIGNELFGIYPDGYKVGE